MNINDTRLDDKIHAVLIGAALALTVALNVDVVRGANFGRDGQAAVRIAQSLVTPPVAAAVLIAANH